MREVWMQRCLLFRRSQQQQLLLRALPIFETSGIRCLQPAALASTTTTLLTPFRSVVTASTMLDHPQYKFRQQHTYRTLPLHDSNRFGGRTSYLREIGPFDHKRRGRLFKRQRELAQWNVDIWAAQQTLRKKWKSRDYMVVEMPFLQSPAALQRVIPEMFTDIPICARENVTYRAGPESVTDSSCGSKDKKLCKLWRGYHVPEDRYHRQHTYNLRQQVFHLEDIQGSLFGGISPYPSPRRQCADGDCGAALNNFL